MSTISQSNLDASELAQSWLKLLARLRDPRMRQHKAALCMQEAAPEACIKSLGFLLSRGGGHLPVVDEALEALVGAMADETCVDYNLRQVLYASAKESEDDDVGRLLLQLGESGPGETIPEARPVIPGQAPASRGMRKSLARAHRIDLVRALTSDPDPSVIANLLENPHLTEADVIKMCAKRPTAAANQRVLYESLKWRQRYHVRLALARNPHSPTTLAMRCQVTLRKKDLKEIAADPTLPSLVRGQARSLLMRRS